MRVALCTFTLLALTALSVPAWADEADAHFRTGVALKQEGKDDEAIAAFEKAVAARPTFGMAWNSLGILYKKKGNVDKAIEAFEAAARQMPKQPNVHANLGMAYFRAGRDDDALRALETACRLNPKDPDVQANLGAIKRKKGDFEG